VAGCAEFQRPVFEVELGPWAGNSTTYYAMGWHVGGPWGDQPTIFHPGGAPSFTASLHLIPDQDMAMVTFMNSGNYVPLPGALEEMRQIPRGVMNLLGGEQPAATAGLDRFYLYFDLGVLVIVALQLGFLIRVARRRFEVSVGSQAPARKWTVARTIVPLVWELGLGALILWSPNVFDGWRHALVWTPDLAITLLVIGSQWVVTGVTRSARLLWPIVTRKRSAPAPAAQPAPEAAQL
jgi:hypothetical protein